MHKQILHVQESVRLVVPTHHDIDYVQCAHVVRVGVTDKTVCGCRIRDWWFWQDGSHVVADLRAEWEALGRIDVPVHFQGMHLGGPVNIRPDMCANCWMMVVDGKRSRWASADPPEDWYDDWSNVTEAEALAAHGFA